MERNQYESPVVQIIQDENGIFICKLKDSKVSYDAHEIKRHFDFYIEQSQGRPYKAILDTTSSFNFPTDGAFDYFLKINDTRNTFAIVTNTLPMRLLIEQTFRYNNVTNALFFRKIEDAYKWLINQ